jgi:enterochelin esterase-like enzyme
MSARVLLSAQILLIAGCAPADPPTPPATTPPPAAATAATPATPPTDPLPQVAAGRIERLTMPATERLPERRVDVWLPDGYPAQAPYAVLYAQDGQMLYDAGTTWNRQEWRMDETAAAVITEGNLRPFIVVGVWNSGPTRHVDYFPQAAWAALTPEHRAELMKFEREPGQPLFVGEVRSDAYLDWLVGTLKPEIDRRFATDPAREATAVMGSSMGGLISMYALLRHPEVFGGAACLSTHWPGAFDPNDARIPEAFLALLRERLPPPGTHRLYFDRGDATLDAWYPRWQDAADQVLRERGWESPWAVSVAVPGADHSEAAWAARLDQPLRLLFAPWPDAAP